MIRSHSPNRPTASTSDLIVIGGGVVGLTLAWRAALAGRSVTVLDRTAPGRAASWAGAGILPPSPGPLATDPLDQLHRRSRQLHRQWAGELRESTGIDTGYRDCGGLYLAGRPGDAAALRAATLQWIEEGMNPLEVSPSEIPDYEPGLQPACSAGRVAAAVWFTDEAQLRNPRHLQALVAACQSAGVQIAGESEARTLRQLTNSTWQVDTDHHSLTAPDVCVCAGAWSSILLQRAFPNQPVATNIVPIKGQMLLLKFDQPPLQRIVNEGPRYLVPREDGYLLVGSTEEEAGFDTRPSREAFTGLWEFANRWLPELDESRLVRQWTGLRPCSLDGFPYLGPIPEHTGVWVASGHYRSGLLFSTATAEFLLEQLDGKPTDIDPAAFQLKRGQHLSRIRQPG